MRRESQLRHTRTRAAVPAGPCWREYRFIRLRPLDKMASVLRRIGLAISVGLADSLNPSTVGPALYMATLAERIWRVTQFTIGVFSVTLVGGLVLTIGPGRLLLGLVPHPQGTVRHVVELVGGVVLLIVAVALWMGRRSLARRELRGR